MNIEIFKTKTVTFAAILLSATASWAQEVKIDFAMVEKMALIEMKEKGVPGAALAIVQGDKVVYAKGFGVANAETGEAVRPEMLFRLGSTTKMFTCAGVLQLAEAGKVQLDRPISHYVTGLDAKIGALTLNQLMSHTAGLRDEAPMFGPHDETALGAKARTMKADYFFTEPDKVYSYSNPGFWLSGLVLEEVSGKLFADAEAEGVFKPLGMMRTTYRPTLAMTYPMALGHEPAGNGAARVVRPMANNASGWPAGSMFSSVEDLSRFVIAFMNDGKLEGKQVLSPKVIEWMSSPHSKIPGSEAHYGYGLQLTTENGVRVVQHAGSRSGYGSSIRMLPDKKVGVVNIAKLSGTHLSKTCEKVLTMIAPELTRTAPKRMNVEMDAAEMGRYVGTYVHGADKEVLAIKDGKLVLKRNGNELAVRKIGDLRFAAMPVGGSAAAEFILVANADGTVEHMFRGGRALRKE